MLACKGLVPVVEEPASLGVEIHELPNFQSGLASGPKVSGRRRDAGVAAPFSNLRLLHDTNKQIWYQTTSVSSIQHASSSPPHLSSRQCVSQSLSGMTLALDASRMPKSKLSAGLSSQSPNHNPESQGCWLYLHHPFMTTSVAAHEWSSSLLSYLTLSFRPTNAHVFQIRATRDFALHWRWPPRPA